MSNLVPLSEIRQIADVMGKSRMFGKTADELLPLMLIAQAEGKHPAIAAQEYDVIQGRPAINSKSALARFQAAGGSIAWIERTDKKASATFSHAQGGSLTVTWTIERATTAGLATKEMWKKYPAQMLSARVIAEGVRAVFPACLSGLYTVEEAQDIQPDQKPKPQKAEVINDAYWQSRRNDIRSIFETTKDGKKVFTPEEIKAYRVDYDLVPRDDADKIDAFVERIKTESMSRLGVSRGVATIAHAVEGDVVSEADKLADEVFDLDGARA